MKKVLFESKIDDHLSLVIPDLSCASEIYALIDKDRAHLRQWLPWVDATKSVTDTRKNLAERIEKITNKQQASFYATIDGEFVASVGFISHDNTEGEIGYWLLSQYQGKGLMTTLVQACIDYGFRELNLDTIIIKCAAGNTKSAGIPLRLGFTQSEKTEAPRVRNDSEQDTLVFTLERSNWAA